MIRSFYGNRPRADSRGRVKSGVPATGQPVNFGSASTATAAAGSVVLVAGRSASAPPTSIVVEVEVSWQTLVTLAVSLLPLPSIVHDANAEMSRLPVAVVRSEIDTVAVPDGPVNDVVLVPSVPSTSTWKVIVDGDCGKLFNSTDAWSQVTSGGPTASCAAAGSAVPTTAAVAIAAPTSAAAPQRAFIGIPPGSRRFFYTAPDLRVKQESGEMRGITVPRRGGPAGGV